MNPGEIYWVSLDPTLGNEIKKKRPVIILNGGHGKYLRLSIVVPITGWSPDWENNPFFVILEPNPINGLSKKSAVDCFQIRAISHERFFEKMGKISKDELDFIKKSISLILDIDPEHCE
ncbi:MAG: type II toxin-antitoxin system PemK/MazF family toxin [Deltaproteobacteria bacterium]|nr:type II toxin-antitoxin system PemK/MazF family toxin [Deltaproteobacteria bacterium]MBW2154108.1 type II toxin-antitoxin system PemK/MazF family toxin [Deltaproteobacteria bacterium]